MGLDYSKLGDSASFQVAAYFLSRLPVLFEYFRANASATISSEATARLFGGVSAMASSHGLRPVFEAVTDSDRCGRARNALATSATSQTRRP